MEEEVEDEAWDGLVKAAAPESEATIANWELLADRAIAVGGDKPRPPLSRLRVGLMNAVAHPKRALSSSEAPQVLRDACVMLRVRHCSELIDVLGMVVRIATTVPQLERLREDLLIKEAPNMSREALLTALVPAVAECID